jgi:hypothetical protein
MANKPMKPVNAPGAAEKRSPIAPTGGGAPGTATQDISAQDVFSSGMRARRAGSAGDNDSALGAKRPQGRTATNANAQYRITATRTPLNQPEYPGTLSGGKILPAVMGSRQNFYAAGRYGPMGG